jgi:hypothetical protein
MFKKTWFLATVAIAFIAAAIGAVVFVGVVLQPQWEAKKLAENNQKACDVFIASVKEADQQTTLNLAYNKIFRGANAALAIYDPAGTSKKDSWGAEYDEFLKLAQIEYSIDALGDQAFATIGEEIAVISAGCNALKLPSPTPTPTK